MEMTEQWPRLLEIAATLDRGDSFAEIIEAIHAAHQAFPMPAGAAADEPAYALARFLDVLFKAIVFERFGCSPDDAKALRITLQHAIAQGAPDEYRTGAALTVDERIALRFLGHPNRARTA
jgi:hypothetical protein